jgi:CarboxypepD_reg-like domain
MRGLITILTVFVLLGVGGSAYSQNQRRIIQLSGVVSDSVQVLPGVHIYVPKAGRGTTTNTSGFFSMPVLVGDSVVISSVGYHRTHYIVPDSPREFLTILVELTPDITFLKDVVIMALPTEELFKEAVLAMNIPLDNGLDQKSMNAEMLALMARTTPMDGLGNYRYYIDQWSNSAGDKFRPIYNPFLNPLNWARFIRDLKKKKK